MNSLQTRIWIGMVTLYIVWGSTYLAIRFAVDTIPPFFMAATRFLIAGSLLYTWRRLAGDPAPTRRQWLSAAVIGLLLVGGGNGFVTWSETRVTSGVAALLVGAVPFWMVLLDAIRPGGQRPHALTVLGVALGFTGILLLIAPTLPGGSGVQVDLLGAGGVLLATLLWAAGSLYSRSAELPESVLLGTSMEMLIGGGGLVLMGTLSGEWLALKPGEISLQSLGGLLYLVVFGTLIGFTAYTWLLRAAPTPLVATYAYVNPLVAVLLGAALGGETINTRILVAAGVIISAVVLTNVARTRSIRKMAVKTAGIVRAGD